jgi:hypothetical protein
MQFNCLRTDNQLNGDVTRRDIYIHVTKISQKFVEGEADTKQQN